MIRILLPIVILMFCGSLTGMYLSLPQPTPVKIAPIPGRPSMRTQAIEMQKALTAQKMTLLMLAAAKQANAVRMAQAPPKPLDAPQP